MLKRFTGKADHPKNRCLGLKRIFITGCLREQGSTAIEYAFVLPIVLLLIVGTIEFGLIMYAQTVLDGALEITAREGSTGNTGPGGAACSATGGTCTVYGSGSPQCTACINTARLAYVTGILNARISGLMNPANLQLNVKPYAGGFAGATGATFTECMNYPGPGPYPPSPPECTQTLGNASDLVVYTANYPWHVQTPLLQHFLSYNISTPTPGIYSITATSVVQNEPFPSLTR